MQNTHKKLGLNYTKDVDIQQGYGGIALSQLVRPTIRDFRQKWHRNKKGKFFHFHNPKSPIMKKYMHKKKEYLESIKPRSMSQNVNLNPANVDNWASSPIQLQNISYTDKFNKKNMAKSTFYLHKEAKGYRKIQKKIRTQKEWEQYITNNTKLIKRNKSSLKALKKKPSRLERDVFGIDKEGNPLKSKKQENSIDSLKQAKDIEQSFFEMKLKYENESFIRFDNRLRKKPLIKNLQPNIENRFSKEIFTKEQQFEMKHEGVFHQEKKSKEQEEKEHAAKIFKESKKDDLIHHLLVKECLRYLREIWNLNPKKNEYHNLFEDIMAVLYKAIYHTGYISPEFPLSFEDQIDSKEIPNYLIVNELKEQISQKEDFIKGLLDSIAQLQGQVSFQQRKQITQTEQYMINKKSANELSLKVIELTALLTQKDSLVITKKKEATRLQFDIEALKQIAYERDQDFKQTQKVMDKEINDLKKEQEEMEETITSLNRQLTLQLNEVNYQKRLVTDLKDQMEKAKRKLSEEEKENEAKAENTPESIQKAVMDDLEKVFKKLKITHTFEGTTLVDTVNELKKFLEKQMEAKKEAKK